MTKKYEILPHTADFKIKVYGKNLKELFENALFGMFESIKPISPACKYNGDNITCSKLSVTHELEVKSDKLEYLLVDFLSEALYLSDYNKEAYLKADLIEFPELINNKIGDKNFYLKAKIYGVKITGFEAFEIKAVTYHDLELAKLPDDSWYAVIVFDI